MRQAILFLFALFCFSCHSNRREATHFPKGGYAYTKNAEPIDSSFYQYPLRDVIGKRDSVWAAFYGPQFYSAYNEPNLSVHPPTKPIIRFIYESGFIGYSAVITLQAGQVVVKEKVTGQPASDSDEANLDSLERAHFHLLNIHYPLSEYQGHPIYKKYYDSLTAALPQLNDPRYYLSLMSKVKKPQREPFTYRKWSVQLSNETYKKLLDSINHSEFWQLPFRDNRCLGEVNDPDGYSLEIAAPEQYHMVISTPCTKPTKFERACQLLMKLSGLQSSFEKYSDEVIRNAQAASRDNGH